MVDGGKRVSTCLSSIIMLYINTCTCSTSKEEEDGRGRGGKDMDFPSFYIYFFINLFYLFIYLFWLRWVFVAAHGLSLVVVNGGYSSLQCAGFLLRWLLLLQSLGPRAQAQ